MAAKAHSVEHVVMTGHIVDSLLLSKVLDSIRSRGGKYHLHGLVLGENPDDISTASIEVIADTPDQLQAILKEIHPHGAVPRHPHDVKTVVADVDGAFPDGFYCSTNFRTEIRVHGKWIEVLDQEMDCGIRLDGESARCIPMTAVAKGDCIVVGQNGIRVFPPDAEIRRHELFEFMASPVSSERPKGVSVREIAAAMKRAKAAGEKVMAVLGPAVVHTGGGEHVVELIRRGLIDVIFAGNALATHDLEQALYGTSLGVSFDRGLPTSEGHEHHLRHQFHSSLGWYCQGGRVRSCQIGNHA